MSNTREKCDEVVPTSEPESIAITTLDQLVVLLQAWIDEKTGILTHLLAIPEGTEVTDSEGKVFLMTGDYLSGFKNGIDIALMEFSSYPIKNVKQPA